jgi:flagellar biosynthesis chaperone FliJ
MAVARALRRLLRIRDIEEEQCRLALEAATGERNRLEHALALSGDRERRGRSLIEASVHSSEWTDRLAGLEETRAATRLAAVLTPRIADMELEVAELRRGFLVKRVERRQVETLIRESAARDAIEAGRRSQQGLDDWYGNRLHRDQAGREPEGSAAGRTALGEPGAQDENGQD